LLTEAVEAFGRFVNRCAVMVPAGWIEHIIRQLPTNEEEIEKQLDPTTTLLLRMELNLLVAWDLMAQGSSNEFCDWARKAAVAARRFEAMSSISPFPFGLVTPDETDLGAETVLDAHGVATVLRLLDQAPGPNQAMLRLFGADHPQADGI
jgi:hypothetical protein